MVRYRSSAETGVFEACEHQLLDFEEVKCEIHFRCQMCGHVRCTMLVNYELFDHCGAKNKVDLN